MGALDLIKPQGLRNDPAMDNVDTGFWDQFGKGLNSSVTGTHAGLRGMSGTVGEMVGADEFAQSEYQRARELQAQAQAEGPRVGSYKNVGGLRDAVSYAGGILGGSAPSMALGLGAGMVAKTALGGLAAGTLAQTPLEAADVAMKQLNDPAAMEQGAGERFARQIGGGAASAGLQTVVPNIIGGKLVGRGAEQAATQSLKQIAGRNAMAIPAEGFFEGSSEGLKQMAANNDKPLDWDQIGENVVGGMVGGAPMAGAGFVGDTASRVAPQAREAFGSARESINERVARVRGTAEEKIDAAAKTAPGKKVKSAYDDIADMVERGKGALDDTLDKILKGEELGSPGDWLKATTDEAKKYMTDFSDSEKVKAVTKWGKEMMDDAGLDAAKRQDIADALANAGDRAAQTTIAALKKTWDMSKKAGGKLNDLAEAFGDGYSDFKRRDVDVESRTVDEQGAPVQQLGFSETPKGESAPATPDAPAPAPNPNMSIKERIAAKRAFVSKAMAEDPDLTPTRAGEMFNESLLAPRRGEPEPPAQPKLSEDYTGLHKVIADAVRENGIATRRPELFDTDEKIQTVARTLRLVMTRMSEGEVKPALLKKITRTFGEDALSILNTVKRVSGDLTPEGTKSFFKNLVTMKEIEKQDLSLHDVMRRSLTDEARTRQQDVETDAEVLIKHAQGAMGKGSPDEIALADMEIADFYTRNYGENADAVRAAVEKAAQQDIGKEMGVERLDENGAIIEGGSAGGFDESGNRLDAGSQDLQVFGLSKPDTAGRAKRQLGGRAMHKDSKYAKQHALDLRQPILDGKANPYAAVDSNGDYVYEVRFEPISEGSEFGHIVVDKYDNSKEFNETELKAMELDTHAHSKSPSRIEVGEYILDAVKIASTMRNKLQGQFESGPTTAKGRLAEGFKHGLSLLMDQFGERISPADAAVIGYINGKAFTWGEAQKLTKASHKDKMSDFEAQQITEIRKEFQMAKDAGAEPEVIQALLDEYKELVGEQNRQKASEYGRGEDYQSRSMPRQRPMSVIEARDAVERGEKAVTPVRSRADDSVTKELPVEYDPDDETGKHYMVRRPENPNGRSKDEDGSRAVDKDGNIHKLFNPNDPTDAPLFGDNDTNRVKRAPWGEVTEQNEPQIPANLKENSKAIKSKQLDLTPQDKNIHRSNMDGSGQFVNGKQLAHNNLTSAIMDWDGEASAAAGKLKARAQTLLANFAMMSEADQRRFISIAPEDVRAGRGLKAVRADSKVEYADIGVANATLNDTMNSMSAAEATRELRRREKLLVKLNDAPHTERADAFAQILEEEIAQLTAYIRDGAVGTPTSEPDVLTITTMAEARAIVNELANKYKDRIVAPGARADSVVGDKSKPIPRNPVRFYNEGKAAPDTVRLPDGKEGQPDPKPQAPVEGAASGKKQAFLKRAAEGDKALLEELGASNDAKGLQRALDALAEHDFEGVSEADQVADNVMAVFDVLTNRLAELVQDLDVAYGLQTTKYSLDATQVNPADKTTQTDRDAVKAHILKVLGTTVKVAWKNLTNMKHAGDYTHNLKLIRLSIHAINPMSTAYHESLHAFFAQLRDAGATDITKVLEKTASSQLVIDQLNERYKNQPEVLKQLKDPEERAAYMYQMWASDPTFKVSIGAKSVFGRIKDFIQRLMGVWTNDERALHIMDYFHSGEYAKAMSSPSAVRHALMDTHRSQILETAQSFAEPLGRLADAVVGSGGARLRDTGIPALIQLADVMKREHTSEGGDQGFIAASRIEGAKMRTQLGELLSGYTQPMLHDAMEALHSDTPALSAEGRLAVRDIKKFLKAAHTYMRQAGVDIGDLGPNYFPRVWDTHYISKNQQAFRDMLEPYIRSGKMKGSADDLIRSLTTRGGVELGIESREPGMQHKKERVLDFITAQDSAQFVEKDLLVTMSSYINQAARKAEWTRRLGNGKLDQLMSDAVAQGASKEQMDVAEDYMRGIDGTLGDDLNPTARRLMGDMIVYQNVRLLPMAAFSMLIDPMGIMVRGGSVGQAFDTFKRGMAGIKDTFKKDGGEIDADQATKWAELVGVVDSAMMSHAMSDVFSQGMVGGTAQKINNAFFKFNLVEGLNRNFRIGASEAAMKFLAHHASGLSGKGPSAHSVRWMKELGLQSGDIVITPAGHIALTQQDGLSAAQVQRVHAAINQWVDGAVLRPDAADKPIWMNDPHYALISHLKQFVFSFQKTILARVWHELQHGNYTPAMALASYVPVMIAADMAKGLLVNAGDTPEWKKGWTVADHVGYGVERAGLFGVGQFGLDVAQDFGRGGTGVGALSGPTIEQLGDIVSTLGGHKQFGNTVLDAMPANALLKGWSGKGEAKPDPTNAD